MRTLKLPRGVDVIVAWDGVTLSQNSDLLSLRWEDWDKVTRFVEEVRKNGSR